MQELKKTRCPRLEIKNNWLYLNGKEASWGSRPNEKKTLYEIAVVCDVYIFEMPEAFFLPSKEYETLKTTEEKMLFSCKKFLEFVNAAKYLGHKTI